MSEKHICFLINLIQDVSVVRPIALLAAKELGFRTLFLASTKFAREDPGGRWMRELVEISSSTGGRLFVFDALSEVLQLLQGKSGVLIAASELSLPPHAITHDIFRIAPSSFVKITLQHGLEGVGFLHSHAHDVAHGREVTFAADILCGWFGGIQQKSMVSSQRSKLHVTGPGVALRDPKPIGGPGSKGATVGIVCETLHSVRFARSTDMRGEFTECFNEFCKAMARESKNVALRPHPAGQYAVRSKMALPANVKLSNKPIYKVDLSSFAYGISTASSILVDMMLAGIPVAVWRDQNSLMDATAYDGLAEITTVRDWLDFAREATARPASFIERQSQFFERYGMPVEPVEIKQRFMTVLRSAAALTSPGLFPKRRTERVLLVASNRLSSLQRMIGDPLREVSSAHDMSVHYLLDQEAEDRLGANARPLTIQGWLEARLQVLDPTVLILERDGGPNAEVFISHALRMGIPIVHYLGQDTSREESAAAEAAFEAATVSRVNRLQDVADVICGPVGRLQAISRKAVGSEPALEELSEWDLRPRRRPLAGAGETIVPIGERILSILALAHRNRKRRRVLFFAPVNLPTFQLSFAKPFSLPEAQREIVYELVTADDIKASGGKPGEASDGERRWLAEKVKLFRPTLIAFCRYAGPHQDWLLDLARQLEIPTVFHIDDDLLNVPAVLGEKKVAIHSAAPRLQAIRQLLDESDLVYCSTERLKRKFASIGALAPLRAGDIYCPGRVISPATMRPVRKVGYMASADHSHNLTALLPAIVEFLRRHPDVSFEFFGSIPRPRELQEFGSRVLTVPPIKDYARFLEEFALREWDVGICPLSPIEFNLSKANTKWVEYTSIGAAVVASGGTVYDGCCADGCGIVAESADEWLLALDALASDPVARFEQVQRAQSRLVNDYTIERLLTQVLDVFDEAAARRNGVGERLYTPSKAA